MEELLRLRQILQKRYTGLSVPSNLAHLKVSESLPGAMGIFDIPKEDAFMKQVLDIIRKHAENAEFTVDQLNREMGMSNTQLFLNLKTLTDPSATQLIRQVRLHRAKELLRTSNLTVAEIAYQTGFTDPSYFTRIFSREIGITTTEFIK